jgi:hypothetical protein
MASHEVSVYNVYIINLLGRGGGGQGGKLLRLLSQLRPKNRPQAKACAGPNSLIRTFSHIVKTKALSGNLALWQLRGRILRWNPDKSLKSFPPCYSQSPLKVCLEISISFKLTQPLCAADFSLLNLPKGKSLGRSKPATSSYAQAPQHTVWDDFYYIQALLNCLL